MASVHSILKSKKKNNLSRYKSKVRKSESIFNLKDVDKNKTYFSGSGSDMIFGMLYLIKKFKNICDVTWRTSKIDTNDFMYDTTIMYICNNNVNAKPKDYQLLFPYGKKNFDLNMNTCKKRFIVVPLFFENPKNCSNGVAHYNVLIIDKQLKTMERFESYGYKQYDTKKTYEMFKSFDDKIAKLYSKYTYYSPNQFCPMEGLQEIEERQIDNNSDIETESDPGGFCGVWSIWYAELRLKHPDMDRKKLLSKASNIIIKQKNLRSYIRKYSGKLFAERKKIIKSLEKNTSLLKDNSKLRLLYNII